MTPQTGFVPSLMLPDGELEEGTLASVVKRIKALETTSENLRDQLVGFCEHQLILVCEYSRGMDIGALAL